MTGEDPTIYFRDVVKIHTSEVDHRVRSFRISRRNQKYEQLASQKYRSEINGQLVLKTNQLTNSVDVEYQI
jgi:hypothetical protein